MPAPDADGLGPEIKDNADGSICVQYHPNKGGRHEVQMCYEGCAVDGEEKLYGCFLHSSELLITNNNMQCYDKCWYMIVLVAWWTHCLECHRGLRRWPIKIMFGHFVKTYRIPAYTLARLKHEIRITYGTYSSMRCNADK